MTVSCASFIEVICIAGRLDFAKVGGVALGFNAQAGVLCSFQNVIDRGSRWGHWDELYV